MAGDRAVVKVVWTEITRFAAYVYLPEGETYETLDQGKYDMYDDLGEINTDSNFEGLEREAIEIYNQQPPAGWRNGIDEIEWTETS